jgi:hypothetical protein
MSAQSIKEARRPRVVINLETKLEIIADFEDIIRAKSIGREVGTPLHGKR